MMEVRNVRRAAIDRWLRVARLPFDTVAHLFFVENARKSARCTTSASPSSVRRAVTLIGALFSVNDSHHWCESVLVMRRVCFMCTGGNRRRVMA